MGKNPGLEMRLGASMRANWKYYSGLKERASMKRFVCVTSALLIWTLLVFFPSMSHAASNELVYQGFLTGENGKPYPQSTVCMTFDIYSSETGVTPLWTETQESVAVKAGGAFTVVLGSVISIPASVLWGDKPVTAIQISNFASEERWLEVHVNGVLMGSRLQLSTCAWAANAQTLDGLTSSSFALLNSSTGAIPDSEVPKTIARTVAVDDQIAALQAQITTLQNTVKAQAATISKLQSDNNSLQSAQAAQGASIMTLQTDVGNQGTAIASMETTFKQVTRQGTTLTFSGMNLQVVSGTGSTDGNVNGLGNIIIGYNEARNDGSTKTTGSHNLILGTQNNYESYGGIVAGNWNEISSTYAFVTGGQYNTASGQFSSVSGGQYNTAGGQFSSVAGGQWNIANAQFSSVPAGVGNMAIGVGSSVSGGIWNIANGANSSVSGGAGATAIGVGSSVSGGTNNTASGAGSSVSGGYVNTASGENSSVSGGAEDLASGAGSSASGGANNTAGGDNSSASGGQNNTASGKYSSVAGGGGTDSNGGSTGNIAFGNVSAILGGSSNVAGDPNKANSTLGYGSTISGGVGNRASGGNSSVSGGSNIRAWDQSGWAAGTYTDDQ